MPAPSNSKSPSQLVAEASLRKGLVTREQLQRAVEVARATRRGLSYALVSQGFVQEAAILELLSDIYTVRSVDVSRISTVPAPVLATLSPAVAKKSLALPLRKTGDTLTVAVSNPANRQLLAALGQASRLKIEPVVAIDFALFDAIKRFYAQEQAAAVAMPVAAPVPAAPHPVQDPLHTTAAPDEPPVTDPAPMQAQAALMMLNLDHIREEKTQGWGGKKLILAGAAMLAVGAVATYLSYSSASSGGSYMVTTGLFLAGGAAIIRGLLTLDD